MYNAHYGLTENPFSIQPDPRFLYLGERHSMAAAMLEYGLTQRSGFIVVTGEVGCGKTTLIQHLLQRNPVDFTAGLISHASLDREEVLRWVLHAFEQPHDAQHKIDLLDQLQQFLAMEQHSGKQSVLIVDEAQNLDFGVLEELRMLSNLGAEQHPLLQLALVGQPQLRETLARRELLQFAQRVTADFHITRLDARETRNYIEHRLAVAGRSDSLFDNDAIARIFVAARGVPRSINVLCDTTLVYGFAARKDRITTAIVDEVLADKNRFGSLGNTS